PRQRDARPRAPGRREGAAPFGGGCGGLPSATRRPAGGGRLRRHALRVPDDPRDDHRATAGGVRGPPHTPPPPPRGGAPAAVADAHRWPRMYRPAALAPDLSPIP